MKSVKIFLADGDVIDREYAGITIRLNRAGGPITVRVESPSGEIEEYQANEIMYDGQLI